jgi:transposase
VRTGYGGAAAVAATGLRPGGVKVRNTVERCINRLKQWRGIATRYEKTAVIYLAGLHIAGILLWSAR